MSKRSSTLHVAPTKLIKLGDTWSIDSTDASDVDPTPIVTEPVETNRFKPVPSGTRARIFQAYSLCFKTKMEATICLNGNVPEVRFASSECSICLSGDEFLQLANCRENWPDRPIFLSNTRVEPLEAGSCRFSQYEKISYVASAQEQDVFPTAAFEMSAFAVNRLKMKLDVMSKHIFRLLESETSINTMFECIVRAYKLEYQRLVSFKPIATHFSDLSRLVECHVSPSHLVKDFCLHSAGSRWNHYSLLASALAQKHHILSLLQ